MSVVADITGLCSVIVAGMAVWNTSRVTTRTLRHDATMRQQDREWAKRRSTYEALADWALRVVAVLQHTRPFFTYQGAPEAPPMPGDDVMRELEASTRLYGSGEVSEHLFKLTEYAKRLQMIGAELDDYDQRRRTAPNPAEAKIMQTWNDRTRHAAFAEYNEVRNTYIESLYSLIEVMRTELQSRPVRTRDRRVRLHSEGK